MTGYTQSEIDSIAVWLKAGDSASKAAGKLSAMRGRAVSRNAIIGIVHRHKTLSGIGFANAKKGRTRPSKQGLAPAEVRPMPGPKPKAKPARASTKHPAPYQLPGRLFIAAIEEIDREGETFRFKSPATSRPPTLRQAHFAAMRFVDCLPDRCRAPLSSDLEEKPGPDMLSCGFLAESGKPYCAYHEVRLTNREHNFLAEAA
ncbi:GcrA family cell cycle regulator [Mesorhizobium australicum]|uniref:GcrA family cell cycle regulator n=1 Tax=Mesorhizobium australicum TaxID=536018 RepID=UPI0033393B93